MDGIAAEGRSGERLAPMPLRAEPIPERVEPDPERREADRRRNLTAAGIAVFIIASGALVAVKGIFLSRDIVFLWVLAGLLALSLADVGAFFRGVVVDWLPFFGALFVYDVLRGLADGALFEPHTFPQIRVDEAIFGGQVPTVWLQDTLFDPAAIAWYDFAAWAVYLTHFFAVFVVAAYLWRKARPEFLRFRNMVLTLTAAAFCTYLLFPAVPPWLASDAGSLGESRRVVGAVWGELGVSPAVAIWEKGSSFANEVAAIPSLHTAYPVLIMLFLWPSCGRRGRTALGAYALAMSLTLVYTAEHYVADIALGWLYALGAYLVVDRLAELRQRRSKPVRAP